MDDHESNLIQKSEKLFTVACIVNLVLMVAFVILNGSKDLIGHIGFILIMWFLYMIPASTLLVVSSTKPHTGLIGMIIMFSIGWLYTIYGSVSCDVSTCAFIPVIAIAIQVAIAIIVSILSVFESSQNNNKKNHNQSTDNEIS
jgi:hypothetical protein